jgi:hypothetical protein
MSRIQACTALTLESLKRLLVPRLLLLRTLQPDGKVHLAPDYAPVLDLQELLGFSSFEHSADYNNISAAAALTHYRLRRFSVTLLNALANSFFKHLGLANANLNARAFRDESRDAGVIIEQSYLLGPASVSNRRGIYSTSRL